MHDAFILNDFLFKRSANISILAGFYELRLYFGLYDIHHLENHKTGIYLKILTNPIYYDYKYSICKDAYQCCHE